MLNSNLGLSKENMDIMALLKQKLGTIILGGLFVAATSFLFLVVSQKNYRVSTDFLVIQNGSGQDMYTLSRSAEYMGKVLSEAVYSELFIDSVANTGKVNAEFLPFDKKSKMKQWSSNVKVSRNSDLGIISVAAFDNSSNNAMGISNAISEVLTTKNDLFRGDGQSIEVRVLSGPVLEKNPSLVHIAVAMVAGFVFGVLITIIGLYYMPKKKVAKTAFNLRDADFVFTPQFEDRTKNRMQESGIFADDTFEDQQYWRN